MHKDTIIITVVYMLSLLYKQMLITEAFARYIRPLVM